MLIQDVKVAVPTTTLHWQFLAYSSISNNVIRAGIAITYIMMSKLKKVHASFVTVKLQIVSNAIITSLTLPAWAVLLATISSLTNASKALQLLMAAYNILLIQLFVSSVPKATYLHLLGDVNNATFLVSIRTTILKMWGAHNAKQTLLISVSIVMLGFWRAYQALIHVNWRAILDSSLRLFLRLMYLDKYTQALNVKHVIEVA